MLRIVPLIPARLVQVALALGAALQGAAAFLPESWRPYAWGLGAVAWLLAGWGASVPTWLAGKPLVPVTLVPVLLGLYQLAETYLPFVLPLLPEGVRNWAGCAYGLLALAAGKVLPAPVKLERATVAQGEVVATTPLVATVSAECSLLDRGQRPG